MSSAKGLDDGLAVVGTDLVHFVVKSPQALAVAASLPAQLRDRYVTAWQEAVGNVTAKHGWPSEKAYPTSPMLARSRGGSPSNLDAQQISNDLFAALVDVNAQLDLALLHEPDVADAVHAARHSNGTLFEWHITETLHGRDENIEMVNRLLAGSYIHEPQEEPQVALHVERVRMSENLIDLTEIHSTPSE